MNFKNPLRIDKVIVVSLVYYNNYFLWYMVYSAPSAIARCCQSIRQSVTFVYCVETGKHILKLFQFSYCSSCSVQNIMAKFRRVPP